MPKTGFIARLAIPVLKEREVMSRIDVPVVSDPVPAVVGTAMSGNSFLVIGRPFPIGALMKSIRSASLYTENLSPEKLKNDLRRWYSRLQVRSLRSVDDTSTPDAMYINMSKVLDVRRTERTPEND